MALSLFLFGLLYFLIGQATLIWPPKKVNPYYGYRSSRAMRNFATYKAAQLYSSRIARNFGAILLIISLFTKWTINGYVNEMSDVMIVSLLMSSFIGLMITTRLLTEKHLQAHFDASGQPKNNN